MEYSLYQSLRDVGARNAFVQREWRLALAHANGALIRRSIEQKRGPDDAVIETGSANRILRAAAPEQRVALPDIQGDTEHGTSRDADRCHVDEAPAKLLQASRGNRVEDPVVLGRLHNRFASETAAAHAGGENDVAYAVNRRYQRVLPGEVAGHDVRARSDAL